MKLDVKAFAQTCAIMWGLALFCFAWWIILFDGPTSGSSTLEQIYRGYHFTAAGSVIGLIWGVADGLICGGIFAWLYNRMSGSKTETAEA